MLRRIVFHATALALILPLTLVARADKPRKPKPPLPAAQYASHDTHSNEHITIAAFPGDTKETAPHTRLDYLSHGFMPIRIIVTNDSSQPLSLDDARILFISSDNYTENAATDDELQRRLFELKSVRGTRIPMPAPIPAITIHHPPVDKKILADDDDFGFKTTTIAPHTTAAGWLYYDVRDLDEPVLKGATLELREVRWAATNKSLDSFEIPLQLPTTH
ncbi:MAG TPA: hypothetical protein VHY48_13110 [Acidobacteriaceae bacterium]|jgi:hypothetical protein|nr:hypothetical protein [Acidobacteriaceae bacterium]